jgi:hypothetical protein
MKIITTKKLAEMLATFEGASMVGIVTATSPKMNQKHRTTKEPNPFLGKEVLRTAHRLGMLGASYEKAVQNRRENEGHSNPEGFRAEKLWNGAGEHVEGSKTLVRHKVTGKLYMVFYPSVNPSVKADAWTVDGEEVAEETLAPFLPPVSEGSKRQETEERIAWRTIALENIRQVVVGGETYTVAA